MTSTGVQGRPVDIDYDEPVFVISVAARLAGMHPQTLRQYDRIGLVPAERTPGGGRRYSLRSVERLRAVQQLSQEEGVNLGGVRRILELNDQVSHLEQQLIEVTRRLERTLREAQERELAVHASYRAELVPVRPTAAEITVWRPRRRRPVRVTGW